MSSQRWSGNSSTISFHSVRRSSMGVATVSIPRSATPRTMKGYTVVARSFPPVSPLATTTPP